MRRQVAVLAGKATGSLSRWTGRGAGATFPGDVARAIDPSVLRQLSSELSAGSVLITGTNGKTTTARLIASLLEGLPARVVTNRTGANLIFGATAAAVQAAGRDGRLRADWAVFEIDEATLPRAIDEIQPHAVVVGNLFRDQLDRYGELEILARTIQRGLECMPPGGQVILNADDPRLGELGTALSRPPIWYGLEDPRVSAPALSHAADARTCPRCGKALEFRAVYVGHDGDYFCPNNDFARPQLEIAAREIELRGLDAIKLSADGTQLSIPLGGLYNAYNLVAAYATGRALGLNPGYIAERLATVSAAFGRQERFEHQGRQLNLMLAKNPTGFNEILRSSAQLAQGRWYLIALNDRIADGQDVSWIWDVDFELLGNTAEIIVPSGNRAHDLALRFKYGGLRSLPPEPNLGEALETLIAHLPPGAEAHLLCTYTAMLSLRAEMVRRGWAQPYWVT
jgi:lipid II isoglutaminyl synthase (glutamine-hydrolysing)